ncbi:hypothetical protein Q5424_23730 [Conexibacter sp. JD483]|uniref:hypothetical protein n=1 Tax=unclassified Conexibacter TaxID=2627773 RepID=UPI0027190FFF|nr:MULTISPECIES: hypothetical protein [unclassified Conexibacter]MDO8189255.1 hypothetical protein [Conexibacter sp. CPCC 205706]MDO8198741.1 hypothetical protein [Conexibacter sp. CPCC 205762]MDR9372128.1 hypothetical protein [Conexibacter sp. JD483]
MQHAFAVAPPFRVKITREPAGRVVVLACGELDLCTVEPVEHAIEQELLDATCASCRSTAAS